MICSENKRARLRSRQRAITKAADVLHSIFALVKKPLRSFGMYVSPQTTLLSTPPTQMLARNVNMALPQYEEEQP